MEFLGCYCKSKGGGKSKRGDVQAVFTTNIDFKCAPRFTHYERWMLTICCTLSINYFKSHRLQASLINYFRPKIILLPSFTQDYDLFPHYVTHGSVATPKSNRMQLGAVMLFLGGFIGKTILMVLRREIRKGKMMTKL